MVDKAVNGESLGELLRAARGKLSAAATEQIGRLGVPIAGPMATWYPAATWAECVRIMAADMFPGVDPDQAQRRLAHVRMDEYARRIKGRLVFALSRLAPRDKTVEKFVLGLRGGASYIDCKVTKAGADDYAVWISDVTGVPMFFAGMIEAGVRLGTGADYQMAITARDGDACSYRLAPGRVVP